MGMNTIKFFVPGTPQTAGSKRAFILQRSGTRGDKRQDYQAILTDDNPKGKKWKTIAAAAAKAVYSGPPLSGALQLDIVFHLLRPQSHFGSGKNAGTIKASAPEYPIVLPDATKLLRCLEDALKGITWHDDSQVVAQHVFKIYDTREGATVEIGPFEESLF